MKKNNLPRGIRNNNPANIRRAKRQTWLGLSKFQNDVDFVQFDDIKYGVRAFFVLARTYRKKYGIKTVRSFIERFAPSSENDVDSYYSFIISNHWFKDDQLRYDYDYSVLLYWIIRFENHLNGCDMCDLHLLVYNLEIIRKFYYINIC